MLRLPKPKMADVAARARVSPATVSRALSNPGMVRPETLTRIRKVISEMGYVPDGPARTLVSKRTHTVGVVVPTLDHAIFARAIQTMQTSLAEAGYQLLVASNEYSPMAEASAVRAMIERRVDAIVLVGTDHSKEVWSLLEGIAQPVILTWSLHPTLDCIGFDNEAAGRMAAEHLLSLGHRRFGVVSGFLRHNDRARARLAGIRGALARAGVTLPAANVSEQHFGIAGGRAGMVQLLTLGKPPTAVIGGNDVLAIGAMIEAQARGLRVPADLSLVGMDDVELAAHVTPGLTTIHLPTAELGRRTAHHVLRRLAGEEHAARIELPIELVQRASDAAIMSKAD